MVAVSQRFVNAVWLHERRYNTEPPRKTTVFGEENHTFTADSVKDRPRSGRQINRKETCHDVELPFLKSTSERSAELRIPRTIVMDHMKHDLQLKPYHPST